MTWLENPGKLLSAALIAVAIGFTIIAVGLTLIEVLAGA